MSSLFPLIINGNDLDTDNYNNRYTYNFPAGSVQFKNSKVAVASVSLYKSWFNISAAYNNNSFTIEFPVFGNLTITLPDGNYSISAINDYIQQQFIANDLYLINTTGDYVYYLELIENSNYYAIQLNCYSVPAALPAGWTDPGGFPFDATTHCPRLIVPSTDFTDIIGFDAGTYPSVATVTDYSVLSSFTPQVSPIQNIILLCSLLNNRYSNPNTVLYSIPIGSTSFGSLIENKPSEFSFVSIQDGNYPSFSIEFTDQNFNKIVLNDTNLVVQLLIKND